MPEKLQVKLALPQPSPRETKRRKRIMSAVIEMVEQFPYQMSLQEAPNPAKEFVLYELPLEMRLRQALEKVAILEQENELLRSEVWEKERELGRRNNLLRNAHVREQTLRAQLAAHML
jgi:hypothetical protein